MVLKTKKELNRRIVQLEENNKDLERETKYYGEALYNIRVQMREELEKIDRLQRRVDYLETQNREIQIKANESCRRAWQQRH